MPILRQTSATVIPSSACFNANAICSSVNLLFLTTCSWPLSGLHHAGRSVTERGEILGQGHWPRATRFDSALSQDARSSPRFEQLLESVFALAFKHPARVLGREATDLAESCEFCVAQ